MYSIYIYSDSLQHAHRQKQTDRLFHSMNNQCTNWKIYILIPCNWHANANIGYIDIKTERHQISDSLFIQCIIDAGTRWEILLLFATYTKTSRQKDRQTSIHTDKQTDRHEAIHQEKDTIIKLCKRQTKRQTDRQTKINRQAGKKTDKKTNRQADTAWQTNRQTDRQTDSVRHQASQCLFIHWILSVAGSWKNLFPTFTNFDHFHAAL